VKLEGEKMNFVHRNIRNTFANANASTELHTKTKDVHLHIAYRCLPILEEKLSKLDLAELTGMSLATAREKFSAAPEFYYAILHWATHARLSCDDSADTLDMIVNTFEVSLDPPGANLEKWMLLFLLLKDHISKKSYAKSRAKITTT
jgi:hypothetical protein